MRLLSAMASVALVVWGPAAAGMSTGWSAVGQGLGSCAPGGGTAPGRSVAPPSSGRPVPVERWRARYDGPASRRDEASDAVASPDGQVIYVTGSSAGPGGDDLATVAFDAGSGERLWVARFDGGGEDHPTDFPSRIATDGLRVYVAGTSGTDAFAAAYEASSGAQLWATRIDRGATEFATALAVADGRVFVTGSSSGDAFTAALSASDGSVLWEDAYDGPAGITAAVAGGGRLYVAGASQREGPSYTDLGFLALAYDAASGARRWVARDVGRIWPGLGVRLALVEGGPLVAAGLGTDELVAAAFDPESGAQRWLGHYGGWWVDGLSSPADLLAGQNVVYLAGTVLGQGQDFVLLAVDASTGALRWQAITDAPYDWVPSSALRPPPDVRGTVDLICHGSEAPARLALRPQGDVLYATGQTCDALVGLRLLRDWPMLPISDITLELVPSCAAYTVAYDAASGRELWAARLKSPGPRGAASPLTFGQASGKAVLVSPDGRTVYVAGSAGNRYPDGADYRDFAVVAYDAGLCPSPEKGPVSGPTHDAAEPWTGPARPLAHGASCEAAGAGL